MVKFAGHTMATPDLDLLQAVKLFGAIGLDGIDIIYHEDFRCAIRPDESDNGVRELLSHLSLYGLRVANLTSYQRGINSADSAVRRSQIDGLKRCVEMAARLKAHSVRIWAGDQPSEPEWESSFQRLVDAVRELGEFAASMGVQLSVENHMGSMALTSRDTVRIVEAVRLPNVGILYDPANLFVDGETDWAAAYERQRPHIQYVHAKNVRVLALYKHLPTLLDEGVVPWADLLKRLVSDGYDGYLALEYEKRWHPDLLPEPAVGLRMELRTLRRLLTQAAERSGTCVS
jgi:L-ribulose-5-phosphate 3-epimerase